MKTKNACILLLAALALTACEYDDSALWEQVNQNTERIAALEAWQAETNTNIQSLQTLLSTTDYITDVKTVEGGYTISFLKSDPITIYHGENGTAGSTPEIGVRQEDDGKWYWTLNGDLLTDANEDPIQANGDSAPVPQLKTGASLTVTQDAEGNLIDREAIYLSVDEGKTWTRVSGEDGDSFFQSVDTTSDPTCVIFTLADGTTFSVPRYTGIKLTFDTEAVHLGYGGTLPVNFTAEGSDQFTTDNLFIIAPDGWKAEVTLPTTRAATKFILNVTAPADAASGAAEGEILMMLDNQQGNTTIGRIKVDCKSTNLVMNNVTAGALATKIGANTNLTSITVTSGTLNETDWAAVRKNNTALLYLDLAGATYEGTDKDNLTYKTSSGVPAIISIKLPQDVTGLGVNAFYNCIKLTTVTLPDKVTSIGDNAFQSCTSLTSIDLPDGLESLGNTAFSGCISLKSIDLPEGVTSIGNRAFSSCKSLTSIDLPEGVTSIDEYAFYNCTSLKSITLPEGLKSIGIGAFRECPSLTSITLPEGVTTIGEHTFQDCTSLESIDLPDKVTSIGTYAFFNCNKLTTVTLPETLTSIGSYAFASCKALTSITLPDKVTSIREYAFTSCTSLTTVTCQATEVPDLGDAAFYNSNKLANIYVPAGSVDDYKAAANWSAHENIIQAIQ